MKTRLVLTFLLLPLLANSQTYKYTTLASFKAGGPSNPSSLIIDGSGNVYGTSLGGGKYGFGTLFKVTPKGVLTVLYNFNGTSGPGSLVRDSHGNFYGTASGSTVFKLTAGTGGKYTFSTLYSNSTFQPLGVTLDSAGNLYGSATACPDGYPCIFEIPAGGDWTDLYDNCCPGEDDPTSNLIVDKTGSLYVGFGYEGIAGSGWVLEYPSGNEFGGQDLPSEVNSLRQDASGNVYGSAYGNEGGADNLGTVFKLTTAGAFSTLYNFCSQPNCTDGSIPGNLTLDTADNIYGTINSAGVFRLTPTGVESVIFSGTVGVGLVMDKSGNLYGTTTNGGSHQLGSVYKLTLEK